MMKMTKTFWVWTKVAEQLWDEIREESDERRIAGTPVWDFYRTSCPRSWVEKGYVEEATTEIINNGLQIVKMNGQKFKVTGGYIVVDGFTLYHPVLGYFSWGHADKSGHILPYKPVGGKNALQEILNAGGFLGFEDTIWIKELIA